VRNHVDHNDKVFPIRTPERRLREVSEKVAKLAVSMEEKIPDGPEKSAGMRKLLEAKDCFVRAMLP
jgi:hypothetical protein